jgi:hypothetical protein
MAIAVLQTDLLFDFSLDTSYDKDIRYYAPLSGAPARQT